MQPFSSTSPLFCRSPSSLPSGLSSLLSSLGKLTSNRLYPSEGSRPSLSMPDGFVPVRDIFRLKHRLSAQRTAELVSPVEPSVRFLLHHLKYAMLQAMRRLRILTLKKPNNSGNKLGMVFKALSMLLNEIDGRVIREATRRPLTMLLNEIWAVY